jgi:hypothetical protein
MAVAVTDLLPVQILRTNHTRKVDEWIEYMAVHCRGAARLVVEPHFTSTRHEVLVIAPSKRVSQRANAIHGAEFAVCKPLT